MAVYETSDPFEQQLAVSALIEVLDSFARESHRIMRGGMVDIARLAMLRTAVETARKRAEMKSFEIVAHTRRSA